MDGHTPGTRGRLACHCLLIETEDQLVLVDTGFGLRDVADPRARIHASFLRMLDPDFREDMTAIRQIEQLGFDARDVRHIVLTHLDFDHAGGLDDFPHAAVHLLASEVESAVEQRTRLDRMRYRPQQWSTRANWRTYPGSAGAAWFGFDCVRQLDGLPPEIVLVPLAGHTHGHTGVAIDTGGGWLLHAGDAYFFYAEMDAQEPYCVPGLRWYQAMMEKDRVSRLWNQERLRELRRSHGTEVRIFCAHDEIEFERFANHSTRESAAAPRPSQIDQLLPHEYARKSEPAPSMLQRLGSALRTRHVAQR